MHKQFDSTLNTMIDTQPAEWAACFGRIAEIPEGPATVLDTDLATTVQADKIFRIDGDPPTLLHLELVVNPRLGIPRDLLRYNILADHSHNLPVESVLILLRPKAQASDQTGVYQRRSSANRVSTEFRYRVERVWERPVDFWLNAGISLAPLALLTDEADDNLETALTRFRSNIEQQAGDLKTIQNLIFSSFVLIGLRYDRERIAELYRRLNMLMQESTTYQGIIEECEKTGFEKGEKTGALKGERKLILKQGSLKFGPPSEEILARLNAITLVEQLESIGEKLITASRWEEIFDTN